MSMTLDQMLALLPDNTTGDIGADDLRAIVTDLYAAAHTIGQRVTYQWSATDSSPGPGHIYLSGGWTGTAGGTAAIFKTSDDGTLFTFNWLNEGASARLILHGPNGTDRVTVDINGPTTDFGTYVEVPYTWHGSIGPEQANNAVLAVDILLSVTP